MPAATLESFFSVQVRLMLVLAPAACCLSGVAVHEVLKVLMKSIRQQPQDEPEAAESSPLSKAATAATKKGRPMSSKVRA